MHGCTNLQGLLLYPKGLSQIAKTILITINTCKKLLICYDVCTANGIIPSATDAIAKIVEAYF